MNAPLPVRAKLIAAAASLLAVFSIGLLHRIGGFGAGEIIFRIGYLVFAVFLAFGGVFGNAKLQLFWGIGLACVAPFLMIALLLGLVRGSDVLSCSAAAISAFVGAYLLLLDSAIKEYRRSIHSRKPGI
jgi:hypothetical protein